MTRINCDVCGKELERGEYPPIMYKNFDEVIAVGEKDTIGISQKDIVEDQNAKEKLKKDNVEENVESK